MYRAAQPRQEIEVTMPDGSIRKGTSWETSPMDIAKEISKGLSERIIIAKVCKPAILGRMVPFTHSLKIIRSTTTYGT